MAIKSPHESEHNNGRAAHAPYWKRAHNDWRFWIGVALMFIAMIIYVTTLDLAWRPRHQAPPGPSNVPANGRSP